MTNGVQYLVSRVGKTNVRGMMPMTSRPTPSSTSGRPRIAASRPSFCSHRAWLMITTGAAAGDSSSSVNVRPTIGFTPSSGNMAGETRDPFRRTGSPWPVSVSESGA